MNNMFWCRISICFPLKAKSYFNVWNILHKIVSANIPQWSVLTGFKDTCYTWSPKYISQLHFIQYFYKYTTFQKSEEKKNWQRVHRWHKWSQILKSPTGGSAEIENVHSVTAAIFNFNSSTRGCFSKNCPSDFW